MATAQELAEMPEDPDLFFDFSELPDSLITTSGLRLRVVKRDDLRRLKQHPPADALTSTPLEEEGQEPVPPLLSPQLSQVPRVVLDSPLRNESNTSLEELCQQIEAMERKLSEIKGKRTHCLSGNQQNQKRLRKALKTLQSRICALKIRRQSESFRSSSAAGLSEAAAAPSAEWIVTESVSPKARKKKKCSDTFDPDVIPSTTDDDEGSMGRRFTEFIMPRIN